MTGGGGVQISRFSENIGHQACFSALQGSRSPVERCYLSTGLAREGPGPGQTKKETHVAVLSPLVGNVLGPALLNPVHLAGKCCFILVKGQALSRCARALLTKPNVGAPLLVVLKGTPKGKSTMLKKTCLRFALWKKGGGKCTGGRGLFKAIVFRHLPSTSMIYKEGFWGQHLWLIWRGWFTRCWLQRGHRAHA